MSKAFPIPPDAEARMEMLFGHLAASRQKVNGAKGESPLTKRYERDISEDSGPDHQRDDFATTAALAEAEIVLAHLIQAEDRKYE